MKHLSLLLLLAAPLFAAELPPEVAFLKKQRDAKVAEINRVYVRELEKTKATYMQAGSLELANLVAMEIKAVPNTEPATEISLEGKWTIRSNNSLASEPREFKGGKVYDGKGRANSWHKEGNVVTTRWGKNGWDKVTINPLQPNIMEGTNSLGDKVTYKRADKL
jgi:hypothetical protein